MLPRNDSYRNWAHPEVMRAILAKPEPKKDSVWKTMIGYLKRVSKLRGVGATQKPNI